MTTETVANALLHKLLDAYERRADPGARAISVGVRKLPGYLDDRDSSVRREVNKSVMVWEVQGWVELEWVRHERGNLLSRIRLRVEAVVAIYAYLGRQSITVQQGNLLALFQTYRGDLLPNTETVVLTYVDRLNAGQSVRPFRIDDRALSEDLLKALVALDHLDRETSERAFSVRTFGDSKRFSVLKSALLPLLREAHPELARLRSEMLWSALGVLPNPGHIYVHGPLVLEANGTRVDLRSFSPDLGLPVHSVPGTRVVAMRARYVLTIENQTSFYDYIDAYPLDGVVVYLAGFPSRARRQLLAILHDAVPQVPFYHWGDLDYGGFAILAHLRESLDFPVYAHLMTVGALERSAEWARSLSRTDQRNLKRLLQNGKLEDSHAVIQEMLGRNVKVEQEAVAPTRPLDCGLLFSGDPALPD